MYVHLTIIFSPDNHIIYTYHDQVDLIDAQGFHDRPSERHRCSLSPPLRQRLSNSFAAARRSDDDSGERRTRDFKTGGAAAAARASCLPARGQHGRRGSPAVPDTPTPRHTEQRRILRSGLRGRRRRSSERR